MDDTLTTDDLNNGLPWSSCPVCAHDCYGVLPRRNCPECKWDEQKQMSDAQRTMREENWMLTDELHLGVRPYPPEVAAFRILQEDDWARFVTDTENNAAMRFFNPEQREFSPAKDWDELCEMQGIAPYAKGLAIPATITEPARDFCRELRCDARMHEDEDTDGHQVFHDPKDNLHGPVPLDCVLVVVHPPGTALGPYFNYLGEKEARVDELLKPRRMSRIRQNQTITHIYQD